MKKATLMLALCLTLISSNFEDTTATIMAYPANIEALAGSSDLVVKAKVLAVEPIKVDKSSPLANDFWKVCRAKLQFISPIKGSLEATKPEFLFRSDAQADHTPNMWIDVGPENYPHFKLEPGHNYILFAKRFGPREGLIQSASHFGLRSWEGFFEAADDSPIAAGTTPHQAVWNELTKALHSKNQNQQKEAALILLNLSCSSRGGTVGSADFERDRVLEAIFGATKDASAGCTTDDCLKEMIDSIGTFSPYSDNNTQMRYLWTKAVKPISAWAQWDSKNNLSIKPAVPFLIKTADGKHKPIVCEAAIRSLGSCQSDAQLAKTIVAKLKSWLTSDVPEIRAAAAVLSADYASIEVGQRVKLLEDKSPHVRMAAAYSFGITHNDQAIPALGKLLSDTNAEVQAAAGLSFMAYPVDKVQSVLAANLSNPPFAAAFLARLASCDPAAMRERLLVECQKEDPMKNPGAYYTPARIAFNNGLATEPHWLCIIALSNYLDGLSGTELAKPEYAKFLDCIEKLGVVDPSRTGNVYQILITHRLNDRAVSFKKKAIAAQPSLPGICFEQPDRELQSGSLKYK